MQRCLIVDFVVFHCNIMCGIRYQLIMALHSCSPLFRTKLRDYVRTAFRVSLRSLSRLYARVKRKTCMHPRSRAGSRTITLIRWIFRQIKGPHAQKMDREGIEEKEGTKRWTIGKSRDRARSHFALASAKHYAAGMRPTHYAVFEMKFVLCRI